jgi:hypothetical protein
VKGPESRTERWAGAVVNKSSLLCKLHGMSAVVAVDETKIALKCGCKRPAHPLNLKFGRPAGRKAAPVLFEDPDDD